MSNFWRLTYPVNRPTLNIFKELLLRLKCFRLVLLAKILDSRVVSWLLLRSSFDSFLRLLKILGSRVCVMLLWDRYSSFSKSLLMKRFRDRNCS